MEKDKSVRLTLWAEYGRCTHIWEFLMAFVKEFINEGEEHHGLQKTEWFPEGNGNKKSLGYKDVIKRFKNLCEEETDYARCKGYKNALVAIEQGRIARNLLVHELQDKTAKYYRDNTEDVHRILVESLNDPDKNINTNLDWMIQVEIVRKYAPDIHRALVAFNDLWSEIKGKTLPQ